MKRILNKFFLPTILTSLLGSTILLDNYSTNIKTNNIRTNKSENNGWEECFETRLTDALSIFVNYYFQEDFQVKFQQEYVSNLQNNLPCTVPRHYDIVKEFEKYIYKTHEIEIKLEMVNEDKSIKLGDGKNIIKANKVSLCLGGEWIDLGFMHNDIKLWWNNNVFRKWLYEEWKTETHTLYQVRAKLEREISYQDFVGFFNFKARDYNEVVYDINNYFEDLNIFHRVSLDEKRSCNAKFYTCKDLNKNNIIENFIFFKLNFKKYSTPLLLVNLKHTVSVYSDKKIILLFAFNNFLLDQNPHINFKSRVSNADKSYCTYAKFLNYLNWAFTKYYNENDFGPKLSNNYFITFRNYSDNQKVLNEGINILKLWINHDENMIYDLPVNWTDERTLIEKKYTGFAIQAITYPSHNLWNESVKQKRINKRWQSVETFDAVNKRNVKSIRTVDLKVGQPQKTAYKWIKDFLIHNVYSRMHLDFVSYSNDQSYNHERIKCGRMLFYEQRFNNLPMGRFLNENDVETIIYFWNPNVLFEKGINLIKTIIKIDGFEIPVEFCVNLD